MINEEFAEESKLTDEDIAFFDHLDELDEEREAVEEIESEEFWETEPEDVEPI